MQITGVLALVVLVVVLIPTPPVCTWDSHLVLLLRRLAPLLQLLCPGAARQWGRGRVGPKAPSCAGRNGRPGCGCTCACRCVPAYGPRVQVRGLVCSHQYSSGPKGAGSAAAGRGAGARHRPGAARGHGGACRRVMCTCPSAGSGYHMCHYDRPSTSHPTETSW